MLIIKKINGPPLAHPKQLKQNLLDILNFTLHPRIINYYYKKSQLRFILFLNSAIGIYKSRISSHFPLNNKNSPSPLKKLVQQKYLCLVFY